MSIEPLFIETKLGRLFALACLPHPDEVTGEAVLIVPPFAEEMNKARHMLSQQSRSLADVGVAALLLDLYGTGDSEGDFSEARWQLWLENMAAAVDWLKVKGFSKISLLGVRSGALLANDFAGSGKATIFRMVFWQPVVAGKQHVNQFFRIGIAESLWREGTPKKTTQMLRQVLEQGGVVEVAGYTLHPDLVKAMDEARLNVPNELKAIELYCFEIVTDAERGASEKTMRMMADFKGRGGIGWLETLVGAPFWQTSEISVVPELIHKTTEAFWAGNA